MADCEDSKWIYGVIGILIGAAAIALLLRTRTIGTALAVPPKQVYTNLEEWEIVKDSDGRTLGMKVHRKAEVE